MALGEIIVGVFFFLVLIVLVFKPRNPIEEVMNKYTSCPKCGGSGMQVKNSSTVITCTRCGGEGIINK